MRHFGMSYQYFAALNGYQLHAHQSLRSGKVLVFFLISLPAVFGIVGLVFDAGLMSADRHNLQHATDAGATAAAMDLLLEKSESQAQATAQQFVQLNNGMPSASCSIQIPPVDGNYAGRAGFV